MAPAASALHLFKELPTVFILFHFSGQRLDEQILQ